MKKILLIILIIFGASFFTKEVSAEAIISVDDTQWYNDDGSPRYFADIFPDASLVRYYAPLPVFFQGWQSTPREDIVDYAWDFGDGSEEFHGFNAAHVYENPGTFDVTLTVKYSDGSTSIDNISIEALARNGETYYVDPQLGSDSYDGKCQTVSGACGPWRTATKAFSQMATTLYNPGDNILFKRGQSFDISTQVSIGHWPKYGYMFASYGSGAKPVIRYKGTSADHILSHGVGFGHVAFVDLEFRFRTALGQHTSGLLFNAGGARNILYLRIDAYDPMNGFFIMSGHGTNSPSTNTFLIDSTIRDEVVYPESVTHLAYWGARLAMLGNYFDNSGNHIAYTSQDKGVVANNIFSRPAFGRMALRIHGHSFEHPSNNIQVSDNQFLGWVDPIDCSDCSTCSCPNGVPSHNGGGTRYNFLLFGIGPNAPVEQAIEHVTFERNIITNAETMMSVGTAENVIIRNNVFISNNSTPTAAIQIGTAYDYKPSKNIKFIGNTFLMRNSQYSNSLDQNGLITVRHYDTGNIHPYAYSDHEDITLANNIFYINGPTTQSRFVRIDNDPELISEVDLHHNDYYVSSGLESDSYFYIGGTDQSTGTVYNLNQWKILGKDTGSFFSNPLFSNLDGPDGEFSAFDFDADLRLETSSPSRNIGYVFPIDSFYDYFRSERNNQVDIGAFEYIGSDIIAPSAPTGLGVL